LEENKLMFGKLRTKLNLGSLEEWQERGRGLTYLYQRFFFYVSTFKNELLKPLGFWNEAVLLLTFLAVRFDFNPTLKQTILGYLGVLFVAGIGGKLLAAFGIIKINQSLVNSHNVELQKILEELEEIKKELKTSKQPENFKAPEKEISAE